MVALFYWNRMKKQRINYLATDRLDIQEQLVFNGQTIDLTNIGGGGVQYYPLTTAYTDEDSTLAQNITEWNLPVDANKTYSINYSLYMGSTNVDPEYVGWFLPSSDLKFYFDLDDFSTSAELIATDSSNFWDIRSQTEKNITSASGGSGVLVYSPAYS